MLRVEAGTGASIELEVWALPAAAFGKFVAAIPPPLSIGTVRLTDGRGVKGFIVEAADIDGAREISAFGGWRAFVAEPRRGEIRSSFRRRQVRPTAGPMTGSASSYDVQLHIEILGSVLATIPE